MTPAQETFLLTAMNRVELRLNGQDPDEDEPDDEVVGDEPESPQPEVEEKPAAPQQDPGSLSQITAQRRKANKRKKKR